MTSSFIELSFSAEGLSDTKTASSSSKTVDPYVVLSIKDNKDAKFKTLGQTEVISKTSSSSWKKSFKLPFSWTSRTLVKIQVFDKDTLSKDDELFSAECSLVDIVQGRASGGGRLLHQKAAVDSDTNSCVFSWREGASTLLVNYALHESRGDTVSLNVGVSGLPFMDGPIRGQFGLQVSYKDVDSDEFKDGFCSAINSLRLDSATSWSFQNLKAQDWVGARGGAATKIRLSVFDQDRGTTRSEVGSIETTFATMIQGEVKKLPLKHSKGKQDRGFITVSGAEYLQKPDFGIFVRKHGTKFRIHYAIDFTLSNNSGGRMLHFPSSKGVKSPYFTGLESVTYALGDLAPKDVMPTVFGFGGSLTRSHDDVDHCFNLESIAKEHDTLSASLKALSLKNSGATETMTSYVCGLYDGIVDNILKSGPTNLAPVIRAVSTLAQKVADSDDPFSSYHVLVIFTDGENNDMAEVLKVLCVTSGLPISIVIVCVAELSKESKKNMDTLDGDSEKVRNAIGVSRDHVQVVNFKDLLDEESSKRNVLGEFPRQFQEYVQDQVRANARAQEIFKKLLK